MASNITNETESLRLPLALFGSKRDVKRVCRRAATLILKGASIDEAVDGERVLLDDVSPSSFILVDDTIPGKHYMGFELVYSVFDKLPELLNPFWEKFLVDIGQHPWALASCLGQDGHHLVYGQARARQYLRSIIAHWKLLNSVGERYVGGLNPGLLYRKAYLIGVAEADSGLLAEVGRNVVDAYEPATLELPPVLKYLVALDEADEAGGVVT